MPRLRRRKNDEVAPPPPTPRAVRRALPPASQLRRERRVLLHAREERLRDLGGLMLEMYRRDQFRQDLLVDRCSELVTLDQQLSELDALLEAAVSRGRLFFVSTGAVYAVGPKTPKAVTGWAVDQPAAKGEGAPAVVQVAPTELVLTPGQRVTLHARAAWSAASPRDYCGTSRRSSCASRRRSGVPTSSLRSSGARRSG